MHMERIDFIYRIIDKDGIWEKSALVSGLVSCLSPEEACNALDVTTRLNRTLRGALLRKVVRDICAAGFLPCHRELIGRMISQYGSLPYQRKRGCSYCLGIVFEYLPDDLRHHVVTTFLTSNDIMTRQRAYKVLAGTWDTRYTNLLEESWEQHADPTCASLVVEYLPTAFLFKHFATLNEALWRSKGYTKLFVRVGESHPEVLEHLRTQDEVTFTYVLACLGQRFSTEEAQDMFER